MKVPRWRGILLKTDQYMLSPYDFQKFDKGGLEAFSDIKVKNNCSDESKRIQDQMKSLDPELSPVVESFLRERSEAKLLEAGENDHWGGRHRPQIGRVLVSNALLPAYQKSPYWGCQNLNTILKILDEDEGKIRDFAKSSLGASMAQGLAPHTQKLAELAQCCEAPDCNKAFAVRYDLSDPKAKVSGRDLPEVGAPENLESAKREGHK